MAPQSYDLPKHLARKAMREAEEQILAQHKKGIFDEGDPNHPKYNNGINYATGKPLTIFGHDTDEFMQRQHQRAPA